MDVSDSCTLLVMWHTSAACPVDTNCTFNGIDFSSLRRSDYYEVEGSGGQKYLLNVCGSVRSDVWNSTDRVAVYEIRKNDSVRIIGQLDGYRVQMSQQKGFVLSYTNSSKGELYTGCHRRNGPNFGRVFLMLKYTDITQNTYIQS